MKRTKTITAADYNTKAKITISLDSAYGGLTRDELAALTEAIASGVMQTLASARYLHVQLSEVRCR